jgi:hypothetical protein
MLLSFAKLRKGKPAPAKNADSTFTIASKTREPLFRASHTA